MVFNNDLIFIHIGKTGGLSCSAYLINNLQPPVFNCHKEVFVAMKMLKVDSIIPRADIDRHCTLAEALEYIQKLNGKQLKDFKKVVAVIRHPYTLEYSFYKHLQKTAVRMRRKQNSRAIELANGDFKTFLAKAGYHRNNLTQDDYVRVDNQIPSCVELVRFEQLSAAFPKAVSPFIRKGAMYPFPHFNCTKYQAKIRKELTDEVKELIYQKHKFMFDSGLYSTII